MWTDELLDKELEEKEERVIPSQWLGVGWLLLGIWLLWESWSAYELLHRSEQGEAGLLRLFQPYIFYVEAYKRLVQGVFATLLGLFYIKRVSRVQHGVLGYVLAGFVFHVVNVVIGYKYPVFFVEEWASYLLVTLSVWSTFEQQESPSKSYSFWNVFLVIITIASSVYLELLVGQPDLFFPKLIGLSCFGIFLLRIIPVYFPAFWEPKRWYNHLYLFVGLIPYLVDYISYSI